VQEMKHRGGGSPAPPLGSPPDSEQRREREGAPGAGNEASGRRLPRPPNWGVHPTASKGARGRALPVQEMKHRGGGSPAPPLAAADNDESHGGQVRVLPKGEYCSASTVGASARGRSGGMAAGRGPPPARRRNAAQRRFRPENTMFQHFPYVSAPGSRRKCAHPRWTLQSHPPTRGIQLYQACTPARPRRAAPERFAAIVGNFLHAKLPLDTS
jgi:hypothetical protein